MGGGDEKSGTRHDPHGISHGPAEIGRRTQGAAGAGEGRGGDPGWHTGLLSGQSPAVRS